MAFYNQIQSFPDQNFYYAQNPYENGYNNHYSYYPPPQPSADFYSYEFAPTPSLIAYNHPGSIQYTVYHSVAGAPPSLEDENLSFPEYDPEPYKGGYDIAQTYGKPLLPSDDICYPNSSSASSNLPPPTPVPVVKEVVNQKEELPNKAQLAEEEHDDDDDDDDDDDEGEDDDGDDDDEEEEEDRSMIVYEGVEESNNLGRGVNQMMPHGYGLEAYDLCENLFGYWPCLSKMNTKCGTCGSEIKGVVGRGDEVDEWKRTADYLFGNPDPYGEWTHQGGPSAYPVYGCDQMQYQYHPQQSYGVYQQAEQYAHNSWFP